MTQVLEQPVHWTEPGAHPVVPGIHRIPLGLPLDGLDAVNAYVVEGTYGLVLIDPGWAGERNEQAIERALGQLGYRLSDVDLCVATHHHWDHYTQAFAWRESLGTRLLVGREERHSIEGFDVAGGRFPNHAAVLRQCGAPQIADHLVNTPPHEYEMGVPYGPPDSWLHHDDQIPLRHGALAVLHTPGHTRGHVVFRHTESGALFSGDHILPTITPSIGFEWTPERTPLRSFLQSLKLVRGLPDGPLLPAHGPVTATAHARVDELLDHHRERLDVVCDEIHSGAETAFEVARALRWTRHSRRLDELALEHQMSAVVEVDAHLDVLTLLGRLTADDAEEARRYAPAY